MHKKVNVTVIKNVEINMTLALIPDLSNSTRYFADVCFKINFV